MKWQVYESQGGQQGKWVDVVKPFAREMEAAFNGTSKQVQITGKLTKDASGPSLVTFTLDSMSLSGSNGSSPFPFTPVQRHRPLSGTERHVFKYWNDHFYEDYLDVHQALLNDVVSVGRKETTIYVTSSQTSPMPYIIELYDLESPVQRNRFSMVVRPMLCKGAATLNIKGVTVDSTSIDMSEPPRLGWSEFCCPITGALFEEPVIAADGVTYERKAIEQWLRQKTVSPKTMQQLSTTILIPNMNLAIQLREAIQEQQKVVLPKKKKMCKTGKSKCTLCNMAPVTGSSTFCLDCVEEEE
jgi:hypothetical protein